MQGTMPGARRRGRPRTAWMDDIKTWTGLSMEESVRMTKDRDKCRNYVHGVANPRIEPRGQLEIRSDQIRSELIKTVSGFFSNRFIDVRADSLVLGKNFRLGLLSLQKLLVSALSVSSR